MQSGFNTNIRHRGVRFHVQTEDSGVERPRITTHLFWGGDILASAVDDYSALLEGAAPTAPGALTDAVRGRMQAQHKSMLKALCAGAHDTAVLERVGPDAFRGAGRQDAPAPPREDPARELRGDDPRPRKSRAS
jgi:hypothetical protein